MFILAANQQLLARSRRARPRCWSRESKRYNHCESLSGTRLQGQPATWMMSVCVYQRGNIWSVLWNLSSAIIIILSSYPTGWLAWVNLASQWTRLIRLVYVSWWRSFIYIEAGMFFSCGIFPLVFVVVVFYILIYPQRLSVLTAWSISHSQMWQAGRHHEFHRQHEIFSQLRQVSLDSLCSCGFHYFPFQLLHGF